MAAITVSQMADEDLRSGFDCWAEVYDAQPNPLTELEQRIVSPLLPAIGGLDVLDVGCGTGRWLALLAASQPRSLTGVDTSEAMLDKAKTKLGGRAVLHPASCSVLPVESSSIDLLLCSFVLSYVADVDGFARECARVMRVGGMVVLTDMHPATEVERHWKRGFQSQGLHRRLETQQRSIDSVADAFQSSGFEATRRTEPCFGEPERAVFAAAGKLADFQSLQEAPAIYVVILRKPASAEIVQDRLVDLRLDGGRCAVSATATAVMSIAIDRGRIGSRVESKPDDARLIVSSPVVGRAVIDVSGYLVLPGLINAHDHLEFGLFPRLGRSSDAPPYRNAKEWATEIHTVHAAQIALQGRVSLETRLWWGGIRNLLCGVTTVCHHNPLHPELMRSGFPVRVVSRFGWAHSLAFDDHLMRKFRDASPDTPFIVHAGEGVDADSADEVAQLDRMGALDNRTVLVHGLATTEESAATINERGASVVICPTSNNFLFDQTLSRDTVAMIDRAAIGSDSPLTAAGDLLDEIRYAHAKIGLDANTIYEMATAQPAGMLRLREGEGTLGLGAGADIIAVRDCGMSPAMTVAKLVFDEVELVLLAGVVELASEALYERLPNAMRDGMEMLEVEGCPRWLRAPVGNLISSAKKVLGQDDLIVGGKRIGHVAAL